MYNYLPKVTEYSFSRSMQQYIKGQDISYFITVSYTLLETLNYLICNYYVHF